MKKAKKDLQESDKDRKRRSSIQMISIPKELNQWKGMEQTLKNYN